MKFVTIHEVLCTVLILSQSTMLKKKIHMRIYIYVEYAHFNIVLYVHV